MSRDLTSRLGHPHKGVKLFERTVLPFMSGSMPSAARSKWCSETLRSIQIATNGTGTARHWPHEVSSDTARDGTMGKLHPPCLKSTISCSLITTPEREEQPAPTTDHLRAGVMPSWNYVRYPGYTYRHRRASRKLARLRMNAPRGLTSWPVPRERAARSAALEYTDVTPPR